MRKTFKTISGMFCLCSFMFIQSCKSDDKKKESADADNAASTVTRANSETNPSASPTVLTAGPFTVLKLAKQQLIDLFSDSSTKKLLIQFSGDNSTAYLNAVAFSMKKNDFYNNTMKVLSAASTATWDTTGIKILGNNELTKKQIKKLINGNINSAAKDLYFYPIKNSLNQIYFIVSTTMVTFKGPSEMITYPPGGEPSKPSPPAPPCETDCGD